MRLIVCVSIFPRIGAGSVHKADNGNQSRRTILGKVDGHQMMLRHPAAKFSRAILCDKTNLSMLALAKIHVQHRLIIGAAAFFFEQAPELTNNLRCGLATLGLGRSDHLLDIGIDIQRCDIVVELVDFALREQARCRFLLKIRIRERGEFLCQALRNEEQAISFNHLICHDFGLP